MYLWVTVKQDKEITRWSEASAALIRALREPRSSDDRRNEMEALWSRNDFPLLISVRQWVGKWQHNAHLSWREASRRTDDVRGLITEASLVRILSYPRLGWHLGFFCFYTQKIQNAKNGLNSNDVMNTDACSLWSRGNWSYIHVTTIMTCLVNINYVTGLLLFFQHYNLTVLQHTMGVVAIRIYFYSRLLCCSLVTRRRCGFEFWSPPM